MAKAELTQRPGRPWEIVVAVVGEAYRSWQQNRTIRLGASLAYYGLFAIPPLAFFTIYVAGIFFSKDDATQLLIETISGALSSAEVAQVEAFVAQVLDQVDAAGFALLSAVVALVAAHFAAVAAMDALDLIWAVPRRRGIRYSVRRRGAAFALVATFSLIIAGLLVVQALVAAFTAIFDEGIFEELISATVLYTALVAAVGGFVLVSYKMLPETEVSWKAALIGAAVTTLAIQIGATAIDFYLSNFFRPTVAATATSVFVLLVAMYYFAQIFLGGAELTRAIDTVFPPSATKMQSPNAEKND